MSKFCGNCGAEMDDSAKACGMCGAPFAGSKPLNISKGTVNKYEVSKVQIIVSILSVLNVMFSPIYDV